MPGKGRKGGGGRDSCKMPFSYVVSGTFTSGLFGLALTPAAFPRVAVEADVWAHFRVSKLSFRLLPTSPITVPQAASFLGGVQDTNPSTFAQVTEILASCSKGVGQTTPSSWVRVSKSELAGPFPWYKSVAGTADPTEESPGTISIVGTGTETFIIEFKGVFEFKTSVATGNTPLAIRLRELVRKERIELAQRNERAVLLKILSTASDTAMKTLP
jgi:hypothetical protein